MIILTIIGITYFQNRGFFAEDFNSLSDREVVSINVRNPEEKFSRGTDLRVEIVNSPESITQGLSGRDEIGQEGMLFVFPEKSSRYFWMKEMKFNLDIIWISGNEIVKISQDVSRPEPETPEQNLPLISAGQPIDKVLELNAGDADRLDIQVGNVVVLKK